MESEFLVKINGEGQTLESIATLYLGMIEEDFNMTIDEMADYFSCSYDYVQKNIAPYIHHIYINFVANKALNKHGDKSKYIELFTKRKLFSRIGFQQFVLDKSVLLCDRERYYLNDICAAAREKLEVIVKKQEKETTVSKGFEDIALRQAKKLYSDAELKSKVTKELAISELPVKLYSLKELVEGIEDLNIKFRYKVLVYRHLESQGIPKIQMQSLIRYRREDLEKTAVFSLPLVVDKGETLSNVEKFLEDAK
ncbi:hypothetical protein P9027_29685 [Bacillus thuringiensis]|uniref:hypothetical protein n=1 Tax=Bacillus thuringiensis TaxID=1428 RepID=UPI002DBEADFC|nr:hypothetical protein [Bacillus thuringiensis]MEC3226092.1 hypothetical protein [Bacillus thuringiensis]MEC3462851.1 hypothetical protein [Bacillus thuringiensis]MEC3556035.1 hypothetical protein [Bacillus thuringiensis]MED2058858.1 hypothetical protein [Bacillus thuringiensis]